MRQVVSVSETFSDSTPEFLFSKVVYQEDGDFFIARAAERSFPPAFDLESLQGKRIALETQHLRLPPDLTDSIRAPDPLPEDTFVKTINFLCYDPDKPGTEPLGFESCECTKTFAGILILVSASIKATWLMKVAVYLVYA